jgi:N4-gp56 family major capsid protein
MANANMGITEVTATAKAEISNLIQSFLIQESIFFSKVSDFSVLAVRGSKSIAVPRSAGFAAVLDKAENTSSVLDDTNTYAVDTINLNKHKYIQFLLEDYADTQSSVAIAQDSLMKAAKMIALQLDKDIITELKAASAAAPDHLIKYIDVATNVIARGDILAARALLVNQNINPRECYIAVSPEKEGQLLNISDFIDASKYGSNEPIQGGVIGKIYGMPVLIHSGLTANETLVWHPTAVGLAIQAAARVQSVYDLKELGTRYCIDTIYGVETLDSGKRNVEISTT